MDAITTKITEGGQLVIPASIIAAMNLADGDVVVLSVREKLLEVQSLRDQITAAQAEFAPFRTSESMVDSFIAERRAEAAKDLE